MLIIKEFKVIIIKYLTKQANVEELHNLSYCLKNTFYKGVFEVFIKLDYLSNYNLQNFDTKKEVLKILKTIEKKRNRISLDSLRYVVFLFVVDCFYFLTQRNEVGLFSEDRVVSIF